MVQAKGRKAGKKTAKRMAPPAKAQKARGPAADEEGMAPVAPTPGSAEGDRDTIEEDLRIQAERSGADKVND